MVFLFFLAFYTMLDPCAECSFVNLSGQRLDLCLVFFCGRRHLEVQSALQVAFVLGVHVCVCVCRCSHTTREPFGVCDETRAPLAEHPVVDVDACLARFEPRGGVAGVDVRRPLASARHPICNRHHCVRTSATRPQHHNQHHTKIPTTDACTVNMN